MTKRKTLYLLGLLLLFLGLFNSCRNEFLQEDFVKNQSKNFQLTSKIIALNQSKHKEKLLPKLKLAKKELNKTSFKKAFGKNVNFGDSIFIDTDNIAVIESNTNFHTYTFRVYRNNETTNSPIENLVLSSQPDGSYKEYIISYNLSEAEKQLVSDGNVSAVNFTGKMDVEGFVNGTFSGNVLAKTVCEWKDYSYYTYCSLGGHHNGELSVEDGGTCPAEVQSILVVDIRYVCKEDGGGGSSEGNVGTPPILGNTGGTGGNGEYNPENGGNSSNNPNGGNNPENPNAPENPETELGGTPTIPIIGIPKPTEPCKQLKQIGENTNIKSKFTTLKNNINGTNEKGFLIRDIAGNETSDIIEGDDDGNIRYPYLDPSYAPYIIQTYGTAHNHLSNNPKHIGIFTPEDLNQLYLNGLIETDPSNPNYTTVPKKAVIFVFTNKGFFALKITDFSKLTAFWNWYLGLTTAKKDDYINTIFQGKKEYNINPTATYEQQITGFLRFMQDKDIGIELYEGNKDTFNNWKKLELENNGNDNYEIKETPCNL